MYLSNRGELFVPAMDTAAFPPLRPSGALTRSVRWLSQRAFGLRPPATAATARGPARVRLGRATARAR
jgi:hypothetical protein